VAETVFCLMGPTASGKTDLACEMMTRFPVEIISVDSALIYREMNIGTAKPTPDILQVFHHHLVDIRDPIETYSAARFCQDVIHLIQEIKSRGHIPLLVGGTMMYFRALQEGLNQLPESNPQIRQKLQQEDRLRGREGMFAWLAEVDPDTAKRLHPHDTQRILRALEVYLLTGQSLSSYLATQPDERHFKFINVGLFPENRAWLHQRIAERFEGMLTLGFLSEVESLIARWPLDRAMPSMRCVGYRQALDYLDGVIDYLSFVAQGVAATRQLAKRQLTWLRSWPEITLMDPNDSQLSTKLLTYFEKHMT
jgi:tRNA dimethylallyltransferase